MDRRTFPRLQEVRMRLMQRLAEAQLGGGDADGSPQRQASPW